VAGGQRKGVQRESGNGWCPLFLEFLNHFWELMLRKHKTHTEGVATRLVESDAKGGILFVQMPLHLSQLDAHCRSDALVQLSLLLVPLGLDQLEQREQGAETGDGLLLVK
jgi:hypothetical protein